MDSSSSTRQVKRPRSATPSKGDSSTQKKKSKGTKKTKKLKSKTRSNSAEGGPKTSKPPRESTTATAQGQMMAQMLSTFSKVEQSRFEAFQRAKFAPHVVGDWVAACLSHRFDLTAPRPLADLVAAGRQGPEIALVVSMLAKIYAQRIVQTAIQLRNDDHQGTTNSNNGSSTSSSSAAAAAAETLPLSAAQLREAFRERQRQGLDPGFFLQPSDERPENAVTRRHSKAYEQHRLAALDAQEKYDAWVKEQQAYDNAETSDRDNNNDDDDDDDKMQVDTSSPGKK